MASFSFYIGNKTPQTFKDSDNSYQIEFTQGEWYKFSSNKGGTDFYTANGANRFFNDANYILDMYVSPVVIQYARISSGDKLDYNNYIQRQYVDTLMDGVLSTFNTDDDKYTTGYDLASGYSRVFEYVGADLGSNILWTYPSDTEQIEIEDGLVTSLFEPKYEAGVNVDDKKYLCVNFFSSYVSDSILTLGYDVYNPYKITGIQTQSSTQYFGNKITGFSFDFNPLITNASFSTPVLSLYDGSMVTYPKPNTLYLMLPSTNTGNVVGCCGLAVLFKGRSI